MGNSNKKVKLCGVHNEYNKVIKTNILQYYGKITGIIIILSLLHCNTQGIRNVNKYEI